MIVLLTRTDHSDGDMENIPLKTLTSFTLFQCIFTAKQILMGYYLTRYAHVTSHVTFELTKNINDGDTLHTLSSIV